MRVLAPLNLQTPGSAVVLKVRYTLANTPTSAKEISLSTRTFIC